MKFKNMVAFLILMENGEGVLSKAPSYIKEKWDLLQDCDYPESLLDEKNKEKFEKYFERWEFMTFDDDI